MLAESFIALHDTNAAAEAAQTALAEATAVHGATHAQALCARSVLASVGRDRSDRVAARAEVDHILAALGAEPKRDVPRRVAALITRADIGNDEGNLPAAEADARLALQLMDQSAGDWNAQRALAWKALSFNLDARVQYESAIAAAEEAYERLVPLQARLSGEQSEWAMVMRHRAFLALAYAGQLDLARQRTLALAENYERLGKGSMARLWSNLGIIERLAGRPQEALQWQQRALAAVREAPPAERERMQIRAELGSALVDLGRHEEALAPLEQALAGADRYLIEPTPLRSDMLLALGRARLALGRHEQALPLLQQASDYWQREAATSRWAGVSALWLARCQARLGLAPSAKATFANAARALEGSSFPGDALLLKQARAQ